MKGVVSPSAKALYMRAWRNSKLASPYLPPGIEHGDYGTYTSYGCRCEACHAANSAYARTWRERVAGLALPDGINHGSFSTYSNYGCRCHECTASARDSKREHRQKARTVDCTGSGNSASLPTGPAGEPSVLTKSEGAAPIADTEQPLIVCRRLDPTSELVSDEVGGACQVGHSDAQREAVEGQG